MEEQEVETSQSQHELSSCESQEVFRLEWFSVLVFMLLLSICELIIFVLTIEATPRLFDMQDMQFNGAGPDFLSLLIMAATAGGVIWLNVIVYTGFFVFLTEYHNAIGKFLDQFLFLPRHVQRASLRALTYSYGVLGVIGLVGCLTVFTFVLFL